MRRTSTAFLLALGCAGGEEPHPAGRGAEPPAAAAAQSATLLPADIAAYQAGRRRELAALRVVLGEGGTIAPERLDSIGAAVAGVTLEEYRRLTGRIETRLRAPPDSGPDWPAPQRARLDSLRVERLVLLVRMQR